MNLALPIFPHDALAGSVFTTVWVGVLVITFFNLRFGWVLSGLVVPGYLVPLLLIRPCSAIVIVLEAMVTYLLVWLFSEKLSRLGMWNNFFGRDRFFALLLVSVIVRLSFEVFLLPPLGRFLEESFAISFDYQNLLHSYGLVIVALIANQFWKPGLIRGLIPLGVTVGITFVLVRYGLMVFTNFSLGNIGYMYEDLAVSMLASPKAYIILLATALAASRMNLRYGWEYSGILIPALLALQWYKPIKLAASFAEAFVILGIGLLLLSLPIFKNATIEGGRKLLLFFNISFGYKLLLGYFILWVFPQHKITDYYAFGYLLATLMAIKMHDKNMLGQVTRATLQTSLVAVIVASLLGFSLQLLPNVFATGFPDKLAKMSTAPTTGNDPQDSLAEIIQKNKVQLYQSRMERFSQPPSLRDIEIFSYGLKQLDRFRRERDPADLHQGRALLSRIGFKVERVQEQYLYIHSRADGNARGQYVINLNSDSSLLVEIPVPLEAWGTVDAGTRLFIAFNARALAMAGAGGAPRDRALARLDSFFGTFHQAMRHLDTLQVRGYTGEILRQLTGERTFSGYPLPEITSRLYIKTSIPAGLDLAALKKFIDPFDLLWGEPSFTNLFRSQSRAGFAELLLNRSDRRNLFFKPLFEETGQAVQGEQTIVGYLQGWLLRGKQWLAESGSNRYQPPTLEELLYMDEAVLTPLVNAARREYSLESGWTRNGDQELAAIQSAASVLGYEIIRYHHLSSNRDYLIVVERRDQVNQRFWGTYVLLLGQANDYVVQIPRPLYEIRTFEFGIHLFDRLEAGFLMIGGTHPTANTDLSSDLILSANKANLFNLFEQVVLREAGPRPMLVAQCRGLGLRPETELPAADVVVSFQEGLNTEQEIGPLGKKLLGNLRQEGLSLKFVDGSRPVMGYEVGGLPQAEYLEQTVNKRFALLWLSPLTRRTYRQQTENQIQSDQFSALGIPSRQTDLTTFIREHPGGRQESLPETLRQRIARYIKTQDMLLLDQIRHSRPAARFQRLIDLDTRQAFLLITDSQERPVLLANLAPRLDMTHYTAGTDIDADFARQFINSGKAILIWGGAP